MVTVLPTDGSGDAVLTWGVAIMITAAAFAVATAVLGAPIENAVRKRGA
jgi:hypothetical protein